jgi:hypothetical protein
VSFLLRDQNSGLEPSFHMQLHTLVFLVTCGKFFLPESYSITALQLLNFVESADKYPYQNLLNVCS